MPEWITLEDEVNRAAEGAQFDDSQEQQVKNAIKNFFINTAGLNRNIILGMLDGIRFELDYLCVAKVPNKIEE